jgi:hypothetical protein
MFLLASKSSAVFSDDTEEHALRPVRRRRLDSLSVGR